MTTIEASKDYQVTLFSAASIASLVVDREELVTRAREDRDNALRRCYAQGNATLQQLANATGLSKARVQQIVKDGEA